MTLMRRERNSLFAVPAASYSPEINERHPGVSAKGNTSYSKLLTASPMEVANMIVAKEKAELQDKWRAEKDEPEAMFIKDALHLLSKRELELCAERRPSGTEVGFMPVLEEDKPVFPAPVTKEANEVKPATERRESEGGDKAPSSKSSIDGEAASAEAAAVCSSTFRPRHSSSSSEGSSCVEFDEEEDLGAVVPEDLDISSLEEKTPVEHDSSKTGAACAQQSVGHGQPAPKESFYFYQSSDGQAIFLHALNVQMLVRQFGSLELCPATIRGRVLEKDATAMTEEMRDRLRYLRHLPLTCCFEVCELDLSDTGLVSDATAAEFAEQLDTRRRRRLRRAREERRRERKIQLEENKRMGKFPERMMRIESLHFYPPMGASASASSALSPPLPSPPLSTSPASVSTRGPSESLDMDDDPVDATGAQATADPLPDGGGVGSFASILRKSPGSFTDGGSTGARMKRSNTFPAAVASAAGGAAGRHQDSENEEESGPPPPPPTSLGDILGDALERATSRQQENNNGSGGNGKGGKKKGKKNKGVSLFNPVRPTV